MTTSDFRAVVAHHEAGHAAVDLWFEHDVEEVTIAPEGDRAGHALVDRSGDDALRYEDLTVSQVPFERRIMAALAGESAQRRFAPDSVDEDQLHGDRQHILEYLDELDAGTEEIRDAYIQVLRLRTDALISRLWPRVERIAQMLIARGTITGAEAQDAFNGDARAQIEETA